MRFLAVLVVLAGLAAGAGWAALEADAAPAPPDPATDMRLTTPVLSARRAPDALLESRRDAAVAAAVGDIPASIPGEACVAVAHEGELLFGHRSDVALAPASTQKLLVAAALLDVAEPDETFTTTAVADAPPVDGVVAGDLFVVGGGDPLLSTDAYIARQSDAERPVTRIEDLADALVDAGVRVVEGSIVGDGTRYDEVRDVPTWPQRYRDQVSAGPLSGLGVNDGLETFTETEVPVNPGRPAADPPAHTAAVVAELLEARGVEVAGAARSGPAPAGAVELATITSPPVRDVVAQMLRYSDNTTAELLVKEIGVRAAGEGTTAGGLSAITASLDEAGIFVDGMTLRDGSGLDLGNRVPCRTLTEVLDHAGAESPLVEALPVAGVSGTLRDRMDGTPAEGNLRAKTGSLRHVAALAGVIDAADGRAYTFGYVSNVPEGEFMPETEGDVQQVFVLALATVPETEPPPEILPTPPAAR